MEGEEKKKWNEGSGKKEKRDRLVSFGNFGNLVYYYY